MALLVGWNLIQLHHPRMAWPALGERDVFAPGHAQSPLLPLRDDGKRTARTAPCWLPRRRGTN